MAATSGTARARSRPATTTPHGRCSNEQLRLSCPDRRHAGLSLAAGGYGMLPATIGLAVPTRAPLAFGRGRRAPPRRCPFSFDLAMRMTLTCMASMDEKQSAGDVPFDLGHLGATTGVE